jgi:hypothetical protein
MIYSGSAKVRAVKVKGVCRVRVTGEYANVRSDKSGKLSYSARGKARFCR